MAALDRIGPADLHVRASPDPDAALDPPLPDPLTKALGEHHGGQLSRSRAAEASHSSPSLLGMLRPPSPRDGPTTAGGSCHLSMTMRSVVEGRKVLKNI